MSSKKKPSMEINSNPSSANNFQDVPRKFARILKSQSQQKQSASNTIQKKRPLKKESFLEPIKPGESFQQFCRRVDNETRSEISRASKQQTKKGEKRKRFLKEKKLKQKLKKHGGVGEEFKDFSQYQDKVQFGERTDAPPTLTKLPKAAQKIKQFGVKTKSPTIAEKKLMQPDNMNRNTTSVKKELSVAQKRIMEADRERVVAHYRQLKAKRELTSNFIEEN